MSGTNVIYRQACGGPVGCCLNDRPNVIVSHVLRVYPTIENLRDFPVSFDIALPAISCRREKQVKK